jgi:hypothetical protein
MKVSTFVARHGRVARRVSQRPRASVSARSSVLQHLAAAVGNFNLAERVGFEGSETTTPPMRVEILAGFSGRPMRGSEARRRT